MLFRSLVIGCIGLVVSAVTPAYAKLRDISLGTKAETAQLLLSFDSQPEGVKVFITETGMDIDILGVSVVAGELPIAATSSIASIRKIPAPGGVRIRLALTPKPMAARAEVFAGSVLVTGTFSEPLDPPSLPQGAQLFAARTKVKPKSKPKPVSHKADRDLARANADHKVSIADHVVSEKSSATNPSHANSGDEQTELSEENEDDLAPPGHDGAPPPEKLKLPVKQGNGMIREASTRMAGKVTEQQCDAAEREVADDPWALENLARYGACLAREGKSNDAREVFERLITFDPETVAAYLGLGALAEDNGDKEQARKYYEEALSLGGSDAEAAQARSLLSSLEVQ